MIAQLSFFPQNELLMLRRLVPLLLINLAVVMTFTVLVVVNPAYARSGSLLILLLFVFNFLYLRNAQRKYAEGVATGAQSTQPPATRRALMWGLAAYGAISYLSAGMNLPMLFAQHDIGPWLGWSVKVGIGTLCLYLSFKIRQSLRPVL